jgi:hypothetical protein
LTLRLQDVNSVFKPKEGAIWVLRCQNAEVSAETGIAIRPRPGTGMTITRLPRHDESRRGVHRRSLCQRRHRSALHVQHQAGPAADQDSIKFTIDGETHEFTARQPPRQRSRGRGNSSGTRGRDKIQGRHAQRISAVYDGLWGIFHFIQEADKHRDRKSNGLPPPASRKRRLPMPASRSWSDFRSSPPLRRSSIRLFRRHGLRGGGGQAKWNCPRASANTSCRNFWAEACRTCIAPATP